MHRDSGIVVDPYDVFAASVHPDLGDESTCRCRPFFELDVRELLVAYAWRRVVTPRHAEQHRCIALRIPGTVKNPHLRLTLIYDHERQNAVIARTHDPIE